MITIIDYGLGNLASIQNMLRYIGEESLITGDREIIAGAEKLILPGVGKFDAGMQGIERAGIREILDQKVLVEKTPILGICLGMQLMTKSSEEGNQIGLSWIDAETKKFSLDAAYKVPHMGWNEVEILEANPLINNIEEYNKFYFVHSYYVSTVKEEESIMWTKYGIRFASGISKENIFGVQFHPEKSHKYGMKLLKNFIELRR